MLNLKGFRSKAAGLTDLLPYAAMVAPGTALLKNGALLAAWEYFGQDTGQIFTNSRMTRDPCRSKERP